MYTYEDFCDLVREIRDLRNELVCTFPKNAFHAKILKAGIAKFDNELSQLNRKLGHVSSVIDFPIGLGGR